MNTPTGALRHDDGKTPLHLTHWEAVCYVTRVSEFGARKYAEHNWRKGMKWTRVVNSLLRHTFARMCGQTHDPESGLLHTGHIAWNALTLLTYEMRSLGEDDLCPWTTPEEVDSDPRQLEAAPNDRGEL